MRIANPAALVSLVVLAASLAPFRTAAEESVLPLGLVKPALDVGLVVADVARAEEFYGTVLGLKKAGTLPLPGGAKLHRFVSGITDVKLIEPVGAELPKHEGGIQTGVGIRLLTFFLPDLDALSERAVAAGIAKPAVLGQKGRGRLMFLFDPDGNQIEILELPDDPEASEKAKDLFQIGLTVADVEASRKFYGETLGLEELDPRPLFGASGPTKYSFLAGGTTVKFWTFDKELPARSGKFDEAVGIRYFTFRVADLAATAATLRERGAKIAQEPQSMGMLQVMFVEDPDGNWIEFVQIGGAKK